MKEIFQIEIYNNYSIKTIMNPLNLCNDLNLCNNLNLCTDSNASDYNNIYDYICTNNFINRKKGDYNNDEIVDVADLIFLKKYLNNYPNYNI